MNQELKLCPFCGGEAKSLHVGPKRWKVSCEACWIGTLDNYDSETAARYWWNTRTTVSGQDEVTKLRSELKEEKDQATVILRERDEAMAKWHAHQKNVPCAGCEGGHDSFWKSVVESPQWRAWEDSDPDWDVDECRGCGHISAEHFQAFMAHAAKGKCAVLVAALEKFATPFGVFHPVSPSCRCERCEARNVLVSIEGEEKK